MSKSKRRGFFSFGSKNDVTEKKQTEVKQTEVKQKPVETDLTECCKKLTAISERFSKEIENHSAALEDHSSRLTHLEQAVFKSEQKPEEIKNTEAVEDTKSVKEEEIKKMAKAVEAVKPETVKKTTESKEAGTPIANVALKAEDEPHKCWMYWDYKHECWRGPKMSIGTALSAVNHDYSLVKEVSVWIRNKSVVRLMTPEEIEKYLP
ncbi:hypothetical protein IKD82_01795 [Candidatus Saccharibacteria bacterium]|nr:hypothetical protein [Candidatus Saccharibacteria bacterium]